MRRHNVEDIHIVDDDQIFKGIDTSVWRVQALYRFLLSDYLSKDVHRVLYLDCDVIVNDSLDELFEMDMSGKSIAACLDPQTYDKGVFLRLGYDCSRKYVCSGVLMMNLDFWRETSLAREMIDYMKSNPKKILFPDQDAINTLCCDTKVILPSEYGVQVSFFRCPDFIREHVDEITLLMESPSIIHYAGYQPWVYCKNKSIHSEIWWEKYKSLGTFHRVKIEYLLGIVKYAIRYLLSVFHLVPRNSRIHIDQYYNHPRVTREMVLNEMNDMKLTSRRLNQ